MTTNDSFNTFLNAALEIGIANAGSGRGAFHPVLLLESASGERSTVIMQVDEAGVKFRPRAVISPGSLNITGKLRFRMSSGNCCGDTKLNSTNDTSGIDTTFSRLIN